MSCWPAPHSISFLSFVQAAVRHFIVFLHKRSLSAILSPIWGIWAIGDVLCRLWVLMLMVGLQASFILFYICLFVYLFMYVCLCECVSVGACVEVGG